MEIVFAAGEIGGGQPQLGEAGAVRAAADDGFVSAPGRRGAWRLPPARGPAAPWLVHRPYCDIGE